MLEEDKFIKFYILEQEKFLVDYYCFIIPAYSDNFRA